MSEKTSDALKILHREFGGDPDFQRMLDEERFKSIASRAIFDARTAAGITQAELARRIGTKQSVIARLEDADYEGHSIGMLKRIGKALDLQLDVRYVRDEDKEKEFAAV